MKEFLVTFYYYDECSCKNERVIIKCMGDSRNAVEQTFSNISEGYYPDVKEIKSKE
jgi:hypothetical protein